MPSAWGHHAGNDAKLNRQNLTWGAGFLGTARYVFLTERFDRFTGFAAMRIVKRRSLRTALRACQSGFGRIGSSHVRNGFGLACVGAFYMFCKPAALAVATDSRPRRRFFTKGGNGSH